MSPASRRQRRVASLGERLDDAREDQAAVLAAEQRLAATLGVRHHAGDVAAALMMPAMLRREPLGLASGVTRRRRRSSGRRRGCSPPARRASRRPRSSCPRRARWGCAAPGPARQRARERRSRRSRRAGDVHWQRNCRLSLRISAPGSRPASQQDLEAVADAEHQACRASANALHRAHHRREAGDGAAAQVVAVGEAAGQDDASQPCRSVSWCQMRAGFLPQHRPEAAQAVAVAPGAGEDYDAEFHASSALHAHLYRILMHNLSRRVIGL